MKAILALALLATPLVSQSRNMSLVAHVPFPSCTATDVWALGDYMLIARESEGFSVIDTRDPSRVSTIYPPGYPTAPGTLGVSDIVADSRYIYVGNNATGMGAFIYDSYPDPMNPTFLSSTNSIPRTRNAHTLCIDGDYLYIGGTTGATIVDVKDRSNPVYTANFPGFVAFTHEITARGNIAYLADWTAGFRIFDTTNKRLPVMIGSKAYGGAVTHNLWPSDDGRYLYSTDENGTTGYNRGHVKVWDIQNSANIFQAGFYRIENPKALVHNVHVEGGLLFVSYYADGVRVCDLTNPVVPREIAYYDTFPGTFASGCLGTAIEGCWGVYPTQEYVLAGDMETGAYILRLEPIKHSLTSLGPVSPGQPIWLDYGRTNEAQVPLSTFGWVGITAVNGVQSCHALYNEEMVITPGINPLRFIEVPIPLGVQTPLLVEFQAITGLSSPLMVCDRDSLTVTVQ